MYVWFGEIRAPVGPDFRFPRDPPMDEITGGVDAAEWVFSRFDADGEVAVAEVGHVDRRQTTGSVSQTGVRSADDLLTRGRLVARVRGRERGLSVYDLAVEIPPRRHDGALGSVGAGLGPASPGRVRPRNRSSDGPSRVDGPWVARRGDGGRETRHCPVGVLRFDRRTRARPGDRFLPRRTTGVGAADDDRNDSPIVARTSVGRVGDGTHERRKSPASLGATTGAAFFDALPAHFDELATAVRRQGVYPLFDGDETGAKSRVRTWNSCSVRERRRSCSITSHTIWRWTRRTSGRVCSPSAIGSAHRPSTSRTAFTPGRGRRRNTTWRGNRRRR